MKIPEIKLKKPSAKALNVVLTIIVVITIIAFVITYKKLEKVNYEKGTAQSESVLQTMTQSGSFRWASQELPVFAAIYCPGEVKIFVQKDGEELKAEQLAGCEYELAQDVQLRTAANLWSGEGLIKFVSDSADE